MKKNFVVLGMVLTLGLTVGCAKEKNNPLDQEASIAQEISLENASTITGIIDEVADYYFSIQDENGVYYQFPFTENNSIDLSTASIGDKIKLYYEGELSDTDMFDGILLGSEMLEDTN